MPYLKCMRYPFACPTPRVSVHMALGLAGLLVVLDSQSIMRAADTADIVRWASEKILESYRNGITAGLQGATVKRPGTSRRSGLFGNAKK